MLTSKLHKDVMRGIDMEAAAEFCRNGSSPQVRQAAGVTRPDEPIRIPSSESCNNASVNYRPSVLASERVLLWTTPYGITFQNQLEQLYPESYVVKLFFVMAESLDESTRNDYGAGLLHFNQFCDRLSIPEQDRMPASEVLLSIFIADAAGSISSSTADNWLAGLRFWHVINGAQWYGERSECLRHVQRGLRHLAPPNLNPQHAPPITFESLVQLYQGLEHSNTFNTAVLAIASLVFWCGCRLEELVIPAFDSSDMTKHVTRSILPIVTQQSNTIRYSTFHIPWTKTTGNNGVDINVTSRDHLTCPHAALFRHLEANPNIPSHAPLFSFQTPTGAWTSMTEQRFLERCNQFWSS
ncbi:DNA breaking-rejoining enzyme [Suillus bovinus]|uniref:DNA breaking-rejoining enzyme n=1 Tax=Suillus bovinus TaxID=48563 RepID=UPI001B8677C1|nr:DNA breaking-rejoining enzyme [Suillus bovinus]KAG2132464.1 DNA breaking-rejoining enzyme [Suillus bovinus]